MSAWRKDRNEKNAQLEVNPWVEPSMNESESNKADRHMEENDPLWRLLGESPRPEPDAWFAARTVARCRYAGQGAESWWLSLANWRRLLGTSLGVALAVALVMMQLPSSEPVSDKQGNVQDAFAIMASLDSSTDSDSSSSTTSTWQDQSL